MAVAYIICVLLYYLFGYYFLPENVCNTRWYMWGAFAFPFILRMILGVIKIDTGYSPATYTKPLEISNEKQVRRAETEKSKNVGRIPPVSELLYPAELPTFGEIAQNGHDDPRAIVYTILRLNTKNERPHSVEDLSDLDFGGGRAAYRILLGKALIKELPKSEEIALRITKDELTKILRERELTTKGRKQELAERLADSGFRLDRRKYRVKYFRLTESGIELIQKYQADEIEAISLAVNALKKRDYDGAVCAYRAFDKKWGFAHTSGKKHTIFAHYDISENRLMFLANYQMRELNNSSEFKSTLRAALLAGLMHGQQGRQELATIFETVCSERIVCPGIIRLYESGDFDSDPEESQAILNAMRKNIAADPRYELEYYIAYVMRLSRQFQ